MNKLINVMNFVKNSTPYILACAVGASAAIIVNYFAFDIEQYVVINPVVAFSIFAAVWGVAGLVSMFAVERLIPDETNEEYFEQ